MSDTPSNPGDTPSGSNQPPATLRAMLLSWKFAVPLVLAAAVLLVLIVYARPDQLLEALDDFDYRYLAPILALAFTNYLIRFGRWHYYLRACRMDVSRGLSAGVFFSGLAMSVTPGKFGELFKCLLLKRAAGVRVASSAPVVIMERFTDLVAVLALAGLGVARYPTGRLVFAVGAALVVALFVTLALSPRFAARLVPLFAKMEAKETAAEGAAESSRVFALLLGGRHLFVGTGLGIVAWFCECVGFYLVFPALGWHELTLYQATAVYALATLAGAVSLLPGGLGATEASMAAMLGGLFAVPRQTAAAATLIIRACTLWFAVAVGVVSYVVYAKRFAAAGRRSSDRRPAA